MKKLIVGITGTNDTNIFSKFLRRNYFYVIKNLGAIAIEIPFNCSENELKGFAEKCDAFIFSGGTDIDPMRYNQQRKAICEIPSLKRDETEFKLLALVMAVKKPILGICRGCQLINVFQNGTLYQDINTDSLINTVNHKQKGLSYGFVHKVALVEGTVLEKGINSSLVEVNSIHHQGIDKLGDNLEINAIAPDGIIEAISLNGYPFLVAVQWHPELLTAYSCQKQIFRMLLESCNTL